MKYQILIGVFASIVVLVGLVVYQHVTLLDGKLHVIFCDVGQGDGIVIRTPKGQTLIVDGGPNDKILSCLSRHMPFWERQIAVISLSHAHLDHYGGLIEVVKRYNVLYFVGQYKGTNASSYVLFGQELNRRHVQVQLSCANDVMRVEQVVIKTLWPKTCLRAKSLDLQEQASGSQVNEDSLVQTLSYGQFRVLLDGDAEIETLSQIQSEVGDISVLKIPHHGSTGGISAEFLASVTPELAVISVGKNKYGHPSKETIEELRNKEIKTLRTDEVGDVEIVTDGKTWNVVGSM